MYNHVIQDQIWDCSPSVYSDIGIIQNRHSNVHVLLLVCTMEFLYFEVSLELRSIPVFIQHGMAPLTISYSFSTEWLHARSHRITPYVSQNHRKQLVFYFIFGVKFHLYQNLRAREYNIAFGPDSDRQKVN